jgi:radical SAM protein with 4Fe4S-binding SPASM domain
VDCSVCPELDLGELSQDLMERLGGRRYPFAGSFELTERCNVACLHCFINQPAASQEARARELTTVQVAGILDKIADAGCLYLLLTGGEPLLRPDFAEIYRYAVHKGFLLTLFTNGTLLTERMADFLAEWRPQSLEITLYGATEGTYERVTQTPGSYARCMRGIERALERGLPLSLKTMVLRANVHELEAMKGLAAQLGVEFRYDGSLWPRQDGGQQPYAQRLSPQELVELELADPERMQEWQKAYRFSPDAVRGDQIYTCGAGRHGFHVDCTGKLSTCMMMPRLGAYDLLRGSFEEGWEALGNLVEAKRQRDSACSNCRVGVLCSQCPGWSQMVHGDDEMPAEFACELGRLRAAQFELSGTQS